MCAYLVSLISGKAAGLLMVPTAGHKFFLPHILANNWYYLLSYFLPIFLVHGGSSLLFDFAALSL